MTSTPHAPLIIDVAGWTLTALDRKRLAHPLVGGVILFARNWKDRAQLTALCTGIKAVRADLLIAVDQEGGRVQRFRDDGFTRLPAMAILGALWQHDPLAAQARASALGLVLAAELRACGVDFSFAPVLDLAWGASQVIGDRAFARQPRVVAALAASVMQGMAHRGMAHCAKHFPGHGWAQADSHVGTPQDRRALETILAADAAPYRALAPVLTAVMPAHVIYPRVDARPAGFSRRWLKDVLRDTLGFTGAVISDDLSMAGARVLQGRPISFSEAALSALAAGCDLALLCNQSLAQEDVIGTALRELEHARDSGAWQPDSASEARRRTLLARGPALAWDDLQADARYRQARALLH